MPAKRRSSTTARRATAAPVQTSNFFDRLEWRGAGPYRGGRVGVEDTRNIAKVRVHPEEPDTAYLAAVGHAHGPNAERGVFRTRDGGKTWKKVLFRSEKAGASDLSIDPNNPRIIYASFWEA